METEAFTLLSFDYYAVLRPVQVKLALSSFFSSLHPQFEQLKDPQVWLDAAGQIVFSLGVGYGGISSFASLNQPQNDFFTDSVICALANAGTSLWASIIMFSFFGFKAHYQSQQCFSKMMNATPGTNQSNCDMSVFLRKVSILTG